MSHFSWIACAIAGASLSAFIMAELGISNSMGWHPNHESAIYLCLLSIAISLIGIKK